MKEAIMNLGRALKRYQDAGTIPYPMGKDTKRLADKRLQWETERYDSFKQSRQLYRDLAWEAGFTRKECPW